VISSESMQKKLIVILIPVIVVAAAVLLTFLYSISTPVSTELTGGRVMDIETYVRTFISELSPSPAQVGGTYHVTEFEAADGRGVVHFEDGHVAHIADFSYTIDEERGITINSFTIRD
jgi:hypothetical protein